MKLTRKEVKMIMHLLKLSNEIKINVSILNDFQIVGGIQYYENNLMNIVCENKYCNYELYDYYNGLIIELELVCKKYTNEINLKFNEYYNKMILIEKIEMNVHDGGQKSEKNIRMKKQYEKM